MSTPNTDRSAISQVIDGLTKAGWTLDRVYNGGDEDEPTPTKDKAMEEILAVDDAFLHVKRDGDTGWVRFVMGNDPEEVVCDHTVNLSDAIDPVTDPWWGR